MSDTIAQRRSGGDSISISASVCHRRSLSGIDQYLSSSAVASTLVLVKKGST